MKKDYYFFLINLLILLIVLIGFTPSFYLRPFGDRGPMQPYLIVHGLICTMWFLAVVIQSLYINTNRIARHRQMGRYFSLIAPALVLSGFVVIYYVIQRYLESDPIIPGEEISGDKKFASGLIWGNTVVLFMFLIYVYLGYQYKFKPGFHKRFMLLASIIITQQAFVRLGKYELLQIGDDKGTSGGIYSMIGPIVILLSLLIYDLFKLKKPHWATVIGIVGHILFFLMVFAIIGSGLGVEWLEKLRG